MGGSTKTATSCGNVERPCVVQGRKAKSSPEDLPLLQCLETESSSIGSFTLKASLRLANP
ncbi:hypothetical protein CEH05_06320 [Halobacillus halophilus]|nr:hypothetical protein CEH05_06320 [Halobacillus halophilus]